LARCVFFACFRLLKIFLDRNGFVAIIPTKTVDLIEMGTGLSDEALDKGEIRG
jgi:hypothetical protein